MLRSARMDRVDIHVLDRDVDALSGTLGDRELLHLFQREKSPAGQDSEAEEEATELRREIREVEGVARNLGIGERVRAAEPARSLSLAECREKFAKLRRSAARLAEEQTRLAGELEFVRDQLEQVRAFIALNVPVSELGNFAFLHVMVGTVTKDPGKLVEELGGRAVLIRHDDRVIAVSSKKGRFALASALSKYGFEEAELPSQSTRLPAVIADEAGEREKQILVQVRALEVERAREAERSVSLLASHHAMLERRVRILEARSTYGTTEKTFLVRGWVPREQVEELRSVAMKATGGRAFVRSVPAEEGASDRETPVLFRNRWVFRPFEFLVRNFGFPRYEEIEPTPFLAVSFALMFGFMFGDVGQGLVILALGLLLRSARRLSRFRDFGPVFLACGTVSVVFGFLFGSVFGNEEILAHAGVPYWFHPQKEMMLLFLAAAVFGAALNSLGLALNVANRALRRDPWGVLLDKFGLVGLSLYWGAIVTGILAALKKPLPNLWLLFGIPLGLFVLREPIREIVRGKSPVPKDLLGYVIETGVEVLEMIVGLLGNTLSFLRIGAFALSHAVLGMVIWTLVGLIPAFPGDAVLKVLIAVAGNLVVIVLEGLVVSIQAVRLEYYEFFSKFYSGEGKPFRPFSLRRRRAES